MLASERAQGRPGFAQADHVAGNQPTSTTREPQGWLAPSLAVIAPVVMPRPMHRPPDCSPASYLLRRLSLGTYVLAPSSIEQHYPPLSDSISYQH